MWVRNVRSTGGEEGGGGIPNRSPLSSAKGKASPLFSSMVTWTLVLYKFPLSVCVILLVTEGRENCQVPVLVLESCVYAMPLPLFLPLMKFSNSITKRERGWAEFGTEPTVVVSLYLLEQLLDRTHTHGRAPISHTFPPQCLLAYWAREQ